MRKIAVLLLILCSCGDEQEQEGLQLSAPLVQKDLCNLRSFLLEQGYKVQLEPMHLPGDFVQPIEEPFALCEN